MKRITLILVPMLFIISCTQKQNDNKAIQDSIRTADSIAMIEVQVPYDSIETSSGYSSDPNYKPTVSNEGKYHTIDGKAKQIQYQGSLEQKEHLEMMDNN